MFGVLIAPCNHTEGGMDEEESVLGEMEFVSILLFVCFESLPLPLPFAQCEYQLFRSGPINGQFD